jgi:hypothetical protein
MSKALEYNLAESKRNGWGPEILGMPKIDEAFVEEVKKVQRKYNLAVDGMLGPVTYRIIITSQTSTSSSAAIKPSEKLKNRIICNGKEIVLKGNAKCLTWKDKGGFEAKKGFVSKQSRDVKHFVTHWDAALSSKSCFDILNQRGLAVHFMIDNDGTIYQTLDTVNTAYHAGDANSSSIGVEVSNAYYTKYNSWYEKNGFGKRRVLPSMKTAAGTIDEHLDFYDAQYEALSALWEAIHRAHNIPLVIPDKLTGTIDWSDFKGFINHFHITNKKIDCYGIDHQRVLNKAIQLSNS